MNHLPDKRNQVLGEVFNNTLDTIALPLQELVPPVLYHLPDVVLFMSLDDS